MKKLSILIALIVLSGCATQSFMVNNERGVESYTVEKRQNFFVAGIGQEEELDATEICGGSDNIMKVSSRLTFVDGFLGFLTQGIYTPRTATVDCKLTRGPQ